MNAVLLKLQASLIQQPIFVNQTLQLCRSTRPVTWGGVSATSTRPYKSMPTHGIGNYRHLVPKEKVKKKKDRLQMKPKLASTATAYGTLNVKVWGYDMTLVEHYAQYIHNLCNRLRIAVSESYALPTQSTEVLLVPEQGTKMYTDAVLKNHRRIVQLSSLPASLSPVFLDILLKNQPEGVHLSVSEHTDADFSGRFKARPELEELMEKMNLKDT